MVSRLSLDSPYLELPCGTYLVILWPCLGCHRCQNMGRGHQLNLYQAQQVSTHLLPMGTALPCDSRAKRSRPKNKTNPPGGASCLVKTEAKCPVSADVSDGGGMLAPVRSHAWKAAETPREGCARGLAAGDLAQPRQREVRRASQSIIPSLAEARPPTERPRSCAKSLLSKNVV